MRNNSDVTTSWDRLKSSCDYYFSRLMDYPLHSPEHVYFCVTNQCNLRCKMCNVPRGGQENDGTLTSEDAKRVIDQVAGMRVRHLIFSGGEPLLRQDIFDLIGHATDRGISMVDVITNGHLIDKATAGRLVSSGLTHITVSIDGLEETNDFIRGKGSFRKAIKAIDLINSHRNNGLPTVGINFTIMDCNINQILPMIELARTKRCNTIVLQPMLPDNTDMQKRRKNNLWVSESHLLELENAIKKTIELKKTIKDISIHVNERILELIPTYFAGENQCDGIECYEGIVRIVISHNGDLWTCQGIYGNLKSGSLRSHWLSFKAKGIRRKIRQCRTHCLQSCIYLNELSDIYSNIGEFIVLVNKQKESREYLVKTMALLGDYSGLLGKRLLKYSKTTIVDKDNEYLNYLESEIARLRTLIKELALLR